MIVEANHQKKDGLDETIDPLSKECSDVDRKSVSMEG